MDHSLINNKRQSFSQHFKTDFIKYLVFALFVLACKEWLITTYGNATPFWDEWNGEAANLYKPFMEHTLSWADLVANHAEHRIFTSRILHLSLFIINGYRWNPFLVMSVNACLYVVTLCLLIGLLTHCFGRKLLGPLLLLSAIVFSLPHAYINTLMGFQSAFFFLIFFSIGCLWMTVKYEPLSTGWWVGIACAVLAFLSLASGIVALAAALAVACITYALGVSRDNKQVLGISIMFILVVTGYMLTPTIAGHAYLKAQSLSQYSEALFKILVWPTVRWWSILGLLIYIPGLYFSYNLLRSRPSLSDPRWFVLALFLWCIFQNMLLAYGRAAKPTAHRYGDFFAIGLLVNFAVLLSLTSYEKIVGKNGVHVSIIIWLLTISIGFGASSSNLRVALENKKRQGIEQEKNVKAYLCTGDYSYLQNKPFRYIPYEYADQLKVFLDDPTIRSILPGNINVLNSHPSKSWLINSNCNPGH